MSDNDSKNTVGLRGSATKGQVRQSFSHGRSKAVVVETKRKRVVVPKPGAAPSGGGGQRSGQGGVKAPEGVTDAEMDRRLKAVQAARAREADEARAREVEERRREEERQRRREEAEAREREERARLEALRRKEEEDARAREEAATPAAPAAPAPIAPAEEPVAARAPSPKKVDRERDDRERTDRAKAAPGADRRRTGKLTLNQALSDEGGRQRSLAAMKRKQERARQKAMGSGSIREKVVREVQLPDTIVFQELANRMAERVGDVVKALMKMGV
ncbi:MAG: translation initiation factor IF-2 associated domain-containing protein, partial [Rhodobacteraceae bacterium]|nr:translation initiation factor IF-2 associated domain-containing protein [Paracoccaceae bacterium]